MGQRLRVVQWTTGKTGSAAVRGMAGHPVLDLVGCYAYSPDKVGRDVGKLCGIGPLGVSATDDIDALLALRPDCVSYMPYRPDFGHLVRILESGINVVTTMYMLSGTGYGPEATEAVREAARRGGATLYGSGVYPGHAPMVALAASAMCQRIDRISVLESLDVSGYPNEQMFRAQGFDLDPDDPRARRAVEASCGSFKDQVGVMARALGVPLDEIRFIAEFATASRMTDFGFMTVGKGRIAGFRGTVAGVSGGRPVIECRFVWKLGNDMTPDWPVTRGYVIDIDGEPSVHLTLESPDGHFDGAVTTAMPCVNAIPAVCAAPPGILNQRELPFVRGAHLIR
jgi:2,4-diaminopentanoate dehydrogenase